MVTREKIMHLLMRKGPQSGAQLAAAFGVTRQALHKHLAGMVLAGQVVRSGSTRSARYVLPGNDSSVISVNRTFTLAGLEEDSVFARFDQSLGLARRLTAAAYESVRFAFTELLNNAIDHSRGDRCTVSFRLDDSICRFVIRDRGIGLFHSVREKFTLTDEAAAALEILKGKTTTWAERHTGQGIFFSARAGERAEFRSHRLALVFDNRRHDIALTDIRPQLTGTEVHFTVLCATRRSLQQLFHQFAPEEFNYEFARSEVRVRLYQKDFVSRSEARRLVTGLDRFRTVTLDFSGVHSLGQGFADEVFRVFLQRQPELRLQLVNAGAAVRAMAEGAVDEKDRMRLTFG